MRLPLQPGGRGHRARVVVGGVEGEAQAGGELLELVVELGQGAIADLEQPGEPAAPDPAGDLLVGVGDRIVLELGRQRRAHATAHQRDAGGRIERLAGGGIELIARKIAIGSNEVSDATRFAGS